MDNFEINTDVCASADFINTLVNWHNSIKKRIEIINNYIHEVNDIGLRYINTKWINIIKLMKFVEKELINIVITNTKICNEDIVSILMDNCDRIENVSRLIDSVIDVILDPIIRATALSGTSRTYSDNINIFWRNVLGINLESKKYYQSLITKAASAGAKINISLAKIIIVYKSSDLRGGISTELYVNVLICHAKIPSIKDEVVISLEVAKDMALGNMADTPIAAMIDSKSLTEYHPIQAISYITTPLTVFKKVACAIDCAIDIEPEVANISMPQAKISVEYNLSALIDQRVAGAIIFITTGLNYKVIERLKTIQTKPIVNDFIKKPLNREIMINYNTPLLVTTDNGKTILELTNESSHIKKVWAPFAGCHPRVEQYSNISSSIILMAVNEDSSHGWNSDLITRYEASLNRSSECGEDSLLTALTSSFDQYYDKNIPKSHTDFYKLVAPEIFIPSNYICTAIARLGFEALDKKIHLLHIKPTIIPHEVIVRESRITQTLQVLDNSRKLLRSIKKAYYIDNEAFTISSEFQKKTILMKSFRTIIINAIKNIQIDCISINLKEFAIMTHM